MEIAKGIRDSDYRKLQLTDLESDDWLKAFCYLEARFNERFIEPVEVLIDNEKSKPPNEKKFGFTILAIDCLLAETLQSFYEGKIDSHKKSSQIFKRFLRTRDSFKNYFNTDTEAEEFYNNFRCGIIHQAQTFGDTKIWTVGELIHKIEKYTIVNRDLFHQKIKEELNIYLTELRKRSDKGLLDNFKAKMDFISGI